MKTYSSYANLKEEHPKLAEELSIKKGKGAWQQEELYYFEDVEDFAEHEVCEGWYYSILGKDISESIFNGAPRLYSFLDLKDLGQALTFDWDESINYLSRDKSVVQTNVGW